MKNTKSISKCSDDLVIQDDEDEVTPSVPSAPARKMLTGSPATKITKNTTAAPPSAKLGSRKTPEGNKVTEAKSPSVSADPRDRLDLKVCFSFMLQCWKNLN